MCPIEVARHDTGARRDLPMGVRRRTGGFMTMTHMSVWVSAQSNTGHVGESCRELENEKFHELRRNVSFQLRSDILGPVLLSNYGTSIRCNQCNICMILQGRNPKLWGLSKVYRRIMFYRIRHQFVVNIMLISE